MSHDRRQPHQINSDAVLLRTRHERAAGQVFAILMLRLGVRLPFRACTGVENEPLNENKSK